MVAADVLCMKKAASGMQSGCQALSCAGPAICTPPGPCMSSHPPTLCVSFQAPCFNAEDLSHALPRTLNIADGKFTERRFPPLHMCPRVHAMSSIAAPIPIACPSISKSTSDTWHMPPSGKDHSVAYNFLKEKHPV